MGGYVFDRDLVELMGGRFKEARARDGNGEWYRWPDREEVLIATRSPFTLVELLPSKPGAGGDWRNFKLTTSRRDTRKVEWWLGWNGERLADSHDSQWLVEHKPEVARWVVKVLKPLPSDTDRTGSRTETPT